MSLPTTSAAVGLALFASTGLYGLAGPESDYREQPRIIVPVAALAQPVDAPVQLTQAISTTNDRSAPVPVVPPAAAAPAAQGTPSGLQPVPTAPARWPTASPQKAAPAEKAAPAPAAMPARTPETPTMAPRPERPRIATQVHAFDGIIASERALLQKSAANVRYEAHIASAASETEAEQIWSGLQSRLDASFKTTQLHLKVIEVPDHGRFVRVMAGDFATASETAQFCQAVISAGRDCRIMRQITSNS